MLLPSSPSFALAFLDLITHSDSTVLLLVVYVVGVSCCNALCSTSAVLVGRK